MLPFADPSQIKFVLSGAESVRISKDGTLVLKHRFGEIRESAPQAWTEDENGNKTTPSWVSFGPTNMLASLRISIEFSIMAL